MAAVSTTRAIDLAQLATELDAALSMSDDGAERTITCHDGAVTQAQLQAAVDAHVPAPPAPTEGEALREQVTALKARLAAAEAATDEILMGALMGEFPPL